MIEEWRPVVGFEETHEVSSLGRVRTLDRIISLNRRGRGNDAAHRKSILLKQRTNRKGYSSISISVAGTGKSKVFCVHVLVARAFLGPRPPGLQVAHWDNDKTNPRLDNLRYATPLENAADKNRHGTNLSGEAIHNSILNPAKVLAIREAALSDPLNFVAAQFGISTRHARGVISRRLWAHIP